MTSLAYSDQSDVIATERALRAHEHRTRRFVHVLKYDERTARALAVLYGFGTLPERDDAA